MGVPRLFRYISLTYPCTIRSISIGDHVCSVNNLYIDSNALIHKAAQVIFSYGSSKTLIPVYDENISYKEKIQLLFELFWSYLCDIVATVSPTKLLFIAIDGPAPCAKCVQQRQRRFINARDICSNNVWNSSNISPGTLFMWELTKFINFSIRKMMMENDIWRPLKIIFSPHNVSAEGEHKLLSYIRSLPRAKEMSHCLWGPDGDLIMLSLITNCPKFLWYRDDNLNLSRASLVDIGMLSDQIYFQSVDSHLYNTKVSVINDFILLGFFVGNDFLPKIPMFHLLEDGFEVMLKEYSKLKLLLTKNDHIIIENFRKFIESIANNEKNLLQEQLHIRVNDSRFINHTLLSCSNEEKVLDYKMYRDKYYTSKLKFSSQEEINNLCKEYMKGLQWVFKYYISGCPSYRWYYPYHYAPLLLDLCDYMKKSSSLFEFIPTDPFLPFQQLLSILPSQCANLLPPPYRQVLLENIKFDIDYEGVNKEYQGIALLPFINPEFINKVYSSINTREYKRNQKGIVREFNTIGTEVYEYKSDYGTIKNCNIKIKK